MSKVAAIGIDIGGTQIKAVAVDGGGTVLGRQQADTSERAEVLLQRLNELLEQLPSSEALGISAPGLVPPGSASVAWMHGRLDCLEGLDWSKQLDRPVYLLNDALAAMAGEAWIGAAQDVPRCDPHDAGDRGGRGDPGRWPCASRVPRPGGSSRSHDCRCARVAGHRRHAGESRRCDWKSHSQSSQLRAI